MSFKGKGGDMAADTNPAAPPFFQGLTSMFCNLATLHFYKTMNIILRIKINSTL